VNSSLDTLEKNVAAAAALIASLRETVERLSQELERNESERGSLVLQATQPMPDPSLVDELERLRAERVAIRENIRRLIKEFDRVSW
jgi:plasmid stabilization system protein ParE